jgi:hypothetical protein
MFDFIRQRRLHVVIPDCLIFEEILQDAMQRMEWAKSSRSSTDVILSHARQIFDKRTGDVGLGVLLELGERFAFDNRLQRQIMAQGLMVIEVFAAQGQAKHTKTVTKSADVSFEDG